MNGWLITHKRNREQELSSARAKLKDAFLDFTSVREACSDFIEACRYCQPLRMADAMLRKHAIFALEFIKEREKKGGTSLRSNGEWGIGF